MYKLSDAIAAAKPENVIISEEVRKHDGDVGRKYHIIKSYRALYKKLKADYQSGTPSYYHEIINKPCNLYFDIDVERDNTDYGHEAIIEAINELVSQRFPDYNITVYAHDASNDKKISIHLILYIVSIKGEVMVQHLFRANTDIIGYINQMLQDLPSNSPLLSRDGKIVIDTQVYRKNGSLRCLYSDKLAAGRPLKPLYPPMISLHFIKFVCEVVEDDEIEYFEPIVSQTTAETPALYISDDISDEELIILCPGMSVQERKPPGSHAKYPNGVIFLKNDTDRICLVSGETHGAGKNGGFVYYTNDGWVFRCHWVGCKGSKLIKPIPFPDSITWDDYIEFADRESYTDIQRFLNANIRYCASDKGKPMYYYRKRCPKDSVLFWEPIETAKTSLNSIKTNVSYTRTKGKKDVEDWYTFWEILNSERNREILINGTVYVPISDKYPNDQKVIGKYLNLCTRFPHTWTPNSLPHIDISTINYPLPFSPIDKDPCYLVLSHIFYVISKRDHGLYNWIIDYMAHILQKPYIKTQVSLVCVGSQEGEGKSYIANLMRALVGQSKSIEYPTVESAIQSVFNKEQAGKVLICLDEFNAESYIGKQSIGKLYNLITSETILLEGKGDNKTEVPNHINIMASSNFLDCLGFVSPKNRRHTLVEVSAERIGDVAYFDELNRIRTNTDDLAKIYSYLLDRSIDVFRPGKCYDTSAKQQIKIQSLSHPLQYLHDLYENDDIHTLPLSRSMVPRTKLFELFIEWTRAMNIKRSYDFTQFDTQIKKLGEDVVPNKKFKILGKAVRIYNLDPEVLSDRFNKLLRRTEIIKSEDAEIIDDIDTQADNVLVTEIIDDIDTKFSDTQISTEIIDDIGDNVLVTDIDEAKKTTTFYNGIYYIDDLDD